ncbi:glycosyltransferase [Chloroflexota bacterium]
MKKRRQNIGILAFPICEPGDVPLPDDTKAGIVSFSNIVDVLSHFAPNLYVITGNRKRILFKQDDNMHVFEVTHKSGANLFTKVARYIYTQLRLSFNLAKLSRNVSLWVFYIGAEGVVLPMVTAKLLGKQTVLSLTGFPAQVSKEQKAPFLTLMHLFPRINLALANRIVVYTERIIGEQNLGKYRKNIYTAHQSLVDFGRLSRQKPLDQRRNLVGYIGRLSEEKGTLNFIEAIPRMLDKSSDISFLIGGDGPLRDKVEAYVNTANLGSKVKFIGWIPYDELSGYLNDLKLLVVPSYSEGLPNIILEAMACGTPVLATAVGAIPDVITDSETGFILEENSPHGISSDIVRALRHPDLEQITDNAYTLVEKEYTSDAAINSYKDVLASLKWLG